ncbi:hypothetical protein [Sulfuriflexus sp.]|uniref:hypothetical protein n=1 Tax=Sulfuriflexus sp. TaxID=2015443 RepID=UPI0028CCC825|nr:hypothetical protein [Sulfuriflexus sp.]MDT8405023.1 hypothetical protein [Sulfuriflexus sp.]
MKSLTTVFSLTLLLAQGVHADTVDLVDLLGELPPTSELVQKGVEIPLDEPTQNKVSGALKTLLETCRADSKTRPSMFRKFNNGVPFEWGRSTDPLRGASFIKVSLGKLEKLRAGNKNVYAKYLLLETPPGNWPRKYMVAYDGSTAIQFTTCSGLVTVDLICLPGIRDHLPKSYAPACKVLPDMREAEESTGKMAGETDE